MLTKEKKNMCAAMALLCLATIACMPEIKYIRYHDFSEGMTNWKYSINNELEQETKYTYDENGELTAIEFFFKGKPDFVSSYLEYFTVTDSSGKELKYRICVKQIGYTDEGIKNWVDSTQVVVINRMPRIKKMTTREGNGILKYQDVYEYDNFGRKVSATRTYADNSKIKHEYSYEDRNNLGVVPSEYYFETPKVYYNRNQYLNWSTLSSEKIKIVIM